MTQEVSASKKKVTGGEMKGFIRKWRECRMCKGYVVRTLVGDGMRLVEFIGHHKQKTKMHISAL